MVLVRFCVWRSSGGAQPTRLRRAGGTPALLVHLG